ncbi:hypothetical protein VPHG_00068 [Vibrio phage 11895-B1]|uniref:hypothetical protein n=1 Tax=Vibrio phage 11895-B1 TaxID=754075 RepID=UPI0002C1501C|nr:hypothetical protein VPHG_00068 [Vibrio phage 11895-B1]AGH32135.1 hypothetical protein VPHG_00068 [Vibrio phage 11895-B1]
MPDNKAFIFTPTKYDSGVGVFTNGNFSMVVEVNRLRKGSNVFTFSIDGSCSHNITRIAAETSWKDAESYLGASVVVVDKKYLKEHFNDLIKPYEETKREQRRIEREKKSEKTFDKPVR